MVKNNIILATDDEQVDITVDHVTKWISNKDKEKLAKFLYYRLYGRYLKPFDFDNKKYKDFYKNGFSIMANCCLLIETFISFSVSGFANTHTKSERCFGIFFSIPNSKFNVFNTGSLSHNDYLNLKMPMKNNNNGIAQDFYLNVRCGILHCGETRNGWKIRRKGPFLDTSTMTINATLFAKELKDTIKTYTETLKIEDFDTSSKWKAYLDKLDDLIKNV